MNLQSLQSQNKQKGNERNIDNKQILVVALTD
jgi:hypothetical protein